MTRKFSEPLFILPPSVKLSPRDMHTEENQQKHDDMAGRDDKKRIGVKSNRILKHSLPSTRVPLQRHWVAVCLNAVECCRLSKGAPNLNWKELLWFEYGEKWQWNLYSCVSKTIDTLEVRYQPVIICSQVECFFEIVTSHLVPFLLLPLQRSLHVVKHFVCHSGQKGKAVWLIDENAPTRQAFDGLTRKTKAKSNDNWLHITPVR